MAAWATQVRGNIDGDSDCHQNTSPTTSPEKLGRRKRLVLIDASWIELARSLAAFAFTSACEDSASHGADRRITAVANDVLAGHGTPSVRRRHATAVL
jgi:hypothetical protein